MKAHNFKCTIEKDCFTTVKVSASIMKKPGDLMLLSRKSNKNCFHFRFIDEPFKKNLNKNNNKNKLLIEIKL